jgi:hypothetical protein
VEIMKVFAFLHWDSIPVTIFERAWRNSRSHSDTQRQALTTLSILSQADSKWDSYPVRGGLALLVSHSLIDQDTGGKGTSIDPDRHRVSLHRLVHSGPGIVYRVRTASVFMISQLHCWLNVYLWTKRMTIRLIIKP